MSALAAAPPYKAPKAKVTNIVIYVTLVAVMIVYAVNSVRNFYKYQKVVAQYRRSNRVGGVVPIDIQEKLSHLNGLDPWALGSWVTYCFGLMCAILMLFV